MKINQKIRNAVNSIICDHTRSYDISYTIDAINDELAEQDLMLANEDGTEFEAIFCGTEGNITIDIADSDNDLVENSVIVFQWYQLASGTYDINTYMS